MVRFFLIISFLSLFGSFSNAAEQTNVIVIVTDDQGYGDMSCHGNPWLKTPNLDRLASQSVCLEDYHVDPMCTPTRAALMTGRYCTRVGAWTVTQGRQLLQDDEVTMANVFSGSGYRTGMFGKWHLGDTWPYAPRFRGFDTVVCHKAGGVDEIGNPAGNGYFDDTYFRNGQPEKFEGYCTDVFFREAMKFIESESLKPFFAYMPLNAMHSPHKVADRYSEPFLDLGHPSKRANFYGMIANFDENLGRLMEFLREKGIENDTIVIFMGDNGTAQGINRSAREGAGLADSAVGFNARMKGQKGSLYEGGHRVACFARWPGHLEAERRVNKLTCHRDWLPTLIELCDLRQPDGVRFDGRSIVPLLEGDSGSWVDRTLFVQRQADQPKLVRNSVSPGPFPHYAVLTENWRMVDGELYDHQADASQQNNVADSHREVVDDLFQKYKDHFADVFSEGKPYARFKLGGAENPTTMTVRDWHPDGDRRGSRRVIWEQKQLGDDSVFIEGFWAVDVLKSGRYSIRLSRFPADAPAPMKASAARLVVGKQVIDKPVASTDESVTFEVKLAAGEQLLYAWLTDQATGKKRTAYFVSATYLN